MNKPREFYIYPDKDQNDHAFSAKVYDRWSGTGKMIHVKEVLSDDHDDRKYILSRLEHYKKLSTQFVQTNVMLEAKNKELEAKLSLAEDLITHPYWATRESEISPSLMDRRKNLITALYEEESKNENI